jgi:hypothetical protein
MSKHLAPNVRIAAGSLLLACACAPALAAGIDLVAVESSFPLQEALLYGSLALLGIAIVLRISKRKHDANTTPEGPDLRWWKQHDHDYMGA